MFETKKRRDEGLIDSMSGFRHNAAARIVMEAAGGTGKIQVFDLQIEAESQKLRVMSVGVRLVLAGSLSILFEVVRKAFRDMTLKIAESGMVTPIHKHLLSIFE
jgi:hypothetical protein